MISKTYWLMTGAAVVIALGAGFGAARILDRPPAEAEHAETGRADDKAGEAAFVALTPQDAAQAGVSVVAVQRGGGAEQKLPGRVAFASGAEAAVDAPLGGAVVRVHVGLGDRVAAGSPLITVRSPDGAASRAEADAAGATVQAARAAERRDRTLFEQGWVSQARLDVTAAETRRAEAQHRAARARVQPPPSGWIDWGGQFENLQRASARLALIVPIVFLTIGLLLVMALRSWKDAALVFAGVPLALVGGALALALRGMPPSISAAVGFIAVSGVATLNGLVLMQAIRQGLTEGDPPAKAALHGAVSRLRAVLTTALVAVLGFVPMAFASGAGAEVQKPLATVVIGGLTTATVLTLIVLPVLASWRNKREASD